MTIVRGDFVLGLMARAAVACPLMCGVALASPTVRVGVSGNVEYATNPFLLAQNNADTIRGVVSVTPTIELRTPRSSWLIAGAVSFSEYSRLYDSSADYRAQVDYRNSLTSRLNLTANAAYDSNTSRSYQPGFIDLGANPTNLPDVTDITLVGVQNRRDSIRGGAGLSYTPDAKNSISLSYNGTLIKVPNDTNINGIRAGDYLTYGQSFSYSRTVNSRLSLGASVGVSKFDYRGSNIGDSTVISPNATINLRVSRNWSISGGLGVTFLRQSTIFGPQNSRDLSANLSACNKDARESFCFIGSRSVAPSSLGSARKTTSLGASYSYRLNSRDDLSFSGNYTRSDETISGPIGQADFVSGSASYTRRLNDRIGLSVNGGFSRTNFSGRRADARVGVGINYNWNSVR